MNQKKILIISVAVILAAITMAVGIPFWKIAGKPADKEAFFEAIRTGDPGQLKEIASKQPSLVNETYIFPGPKSREYTPLQLAAEKGNVAAIQYLLKNGAEIDKTTKTLPYTPLTLAAMRRKSKAAWELMKNGAVADTKGDTGKNLLIMALGEDNKEKD